MLPVQVQVLKCFFGSAVQSLAFISPKLEAMLRLMYGSEADIYLNLRRNGYHPQQRRQPARMLAGILPLLPRFAASD